MEDKKTILVTGGAGFIGSEFSRKFLNRFKKMYVLDCLTYSGKISRLASVLQQKNLEFIELDINKVNRVKRLFKEVDYVVHFAAETHVDRSIANGFPFITSNINGTYELLNLAQQFPKILTIIVSTDEVYGSIEVGEADESTKLNPTSVYSASKAAADFLALSQFYTHKQKIIVTRCCNNYGPFQELEKFVPNSINAIINGKDVTVYGDGKNIREWIHVTDHCKAIYSLLEFGKYGNVYNIGTGERKTNLDLVKLLYELHGEFPPKIKSVTDRKGHDFRYALDSRKIERQVKWKPEIRLEDGLRDLIKHFNDFQKELEKK